MASIVSFVAVGEMVDYCCSKASTLAFYEGLTQELRHFYAAFNVLTMWVNTILVQFEDLILIYILVSFIRFGSILRWLRDWPIINQHSASQFWLQKLYQREWWSRSLSVKVGKLCCPGSCLSSDLSEACHSGFKRWYVLISRKLSSESEQCARVVNDGNGMRRTMRQVPCSSATKNVYIRISVGHATVGSFFTISVTTIGLNSVTYCKAGKSTEAQPSQESSTGTNKTVMS